jgi:four helix bundle protein
MRNFKKLDIWQEGISLTKTVYQLVGLLPDNEKYGLRNQICRAVVSVPANIAEGCSRRSEKDFKRFLEISIGSAFELETHLIVALEVGLYTEEIINETILKLNRLQKKINAFINKLNGSINGC